MSFKMECICEYGQRGLRFPEDKKCAVCNLNFTKKYISEFDEALMEMELNLKYQK